MAVAVYSKKNGREKEKKNEIKTERQSKTNRYNNFGVVKCPFWNVKFYELGIQKFST